MSVFTSDEQVVTEIAARLQQVRKANGYLTDLGTTVHDGKVSVSDNDVPCVCIIETGDSVQSRPGKLPAFNIGVRFALVAYVPCDPENPSVAARAATRDIRNAIFAGDGRFGGKARQVNYLGRQIGTRADGVAVVMAVVEIEIEYVDQPAAPQQ